jgi:hypothetical protein
LAQVTCEFQPRANPDTYLASLDTLAAQGCFGDSRDDSQISKEVIKGVAGINTNPESSDILSANKTRLLEILDQIKGSLISTMSKMDDKWKSYAAITLGELLSAKQEILDNKSTIRAVHWQRQPDYGFFEGDITGQYLIKYDSDIRMACSDIGFNDNCQNALRSIADLTRHIALVQTVLNNPVREQLAELHKELVKLDEQWDYYFDEARSQFWWEFTANNLLYNPPGNKFSAPPHGQLILFHPQAAVEYVGGDATVDKAYNLVGIVELVGYNRLRWRKGGAYSNWPVGISLIVSYVPATLGDDFGYGLMIHVKNNYSFGVTRRDTGVDEETTWVFSVDLNKLFLEKSLEARKWFRFGD